MGFQTLFQYFMQNYMFKQVYFINCEILEHILSCAKGILKCWQMYGTTTMCLYNALVYTVLEILGLCLTPIIIVRL